MRDWIFVRNGGINRTGICVTGLFVKAIYIDITFMVVNDETLEPTTQVSACESSSIEILLGLLWLRVNLIVRTGATATRFRNV